MPPPDELLAFFKPYIADTEDVLNQAMQKEDRTALQMLDEIHKFISLAEKVGELRRSTEQIQAFFYVSLLETLYNLSYPENPLPSKQRIAKFFDEFMGEDEKTFMYGLQRSSNDEECLGKKGFCLSRPDLIKLLYDLRCAFTHEGVSSRFHYARDGCDLMCRIKHQNGKYSTYDMKMSFEEFRDVFVRMGLRCVRMTLSRAA